MHVSTYLLLKKLIPAIFRHIFASKRAKSGYIWAEKVLKSYYLLRVFFKKRFRSPHNRNLVTSTGLRLLARQPPLGSQMAPEKSDLKTQEPLVSLHVALSY